MLHPLKYLALFVLLVCSTYDVIAEDAETAKKNETEELLKQLHDAFGDKELVDDIIEYMHTVTIHPIAYPKAREILGPEHVPTLTRAGGLQQRCGILLGIVKNFHSGLKDFKCNMLSGQAAERCEPCSNSPQPDCPPCDTSCSACPVPCPVSFGCRYPNGDCNCDGPCPLDYVYPFDDPPNNKTKTTTTTRPRGAGTTTTTKPRVKTVTPMAQLASSPKPEDNNCCGQESQTRYNLTNPKCPCATKIPNTTEAPNTSLVHNIQTTKRSERRSTTTKKSEPSTTRRRRTRKPRTTSLAPSPTTTVKPTEAVPTTAKTTTTQIPETTTETPETTTETPETTTKTPETTTKAPETTTKTPETTTKTPETTTNAPDSKENQECGYEDTEPQPAPIYNIEDYKPKPGESKGVFLFYKNVYKVVENSTIMFKLDTLIDHVPESTGGREGDLAKKILTKFNDLPKEPERSKSGSQRSYAYQSARGNTRGIIGHIAHALASKHCKCPSCYKPIKCSRCLPKKCKNNPRCPPCKCDKCPCEKCREFNREAVVRWGQKPQAKPSQMKKKPSSVKTNGRQQPNRKPVANIKARNNAPAPAAGAVTKATACRGFTCSYQPTCGRARLNSLTPSSTQSGYIVNGEDSREGEWPMYVRLSLHHGGGSFGLCGGVLISDRHVLTAGHCIVSSGAETRNKKYISPGQVEVHIGDYNRDRQDRVEKTIRASSICRTARYNDLQGGTQYDYSVITLSQPVQIGDYVQPACLPYQPINYNSKCYVVGMGVTGFRNKNRDQGIYLPILQKMQVRKVSCKVWGFSDTDPSRHCFTKANGPGDTCGGDSGGPIICLQNNRWVVVGLVSYGSALCDGSEHPGWVGVYTRVDALISYIQSDCGV